RSPDGQRSILAWRRADPDAALAMTTHAPAPGGYWVHPVRLAWDQLATPLLALACECSTTRLVPARSFPGQDGSSRDGPASFVLMLASWGLKLIAWMHTTMASACAPPVESQTRDATHQPDLPTRYSGLDQQRITGAPC